MLKEQAKADLLIAIEKDFPHASYQSKEQMLSIIDSAAKCSMMLTGREISSKKTSAIVAQLKSLLSILGME